MSALAFGPTLEINRIWSMINRISNPGSEAKSGANPVNVSAAQAMRLEINRIYRIYMACLTRMREGKVVVASSRYVYASRTRMCKTASPNPVNPVDLQAVALACENTSRIWTGFGLATADPNPADIRDQGDGTIRASRHLITTAVTPDIHARCGALVLHGHAEGLHARVDLTPLNTLGEIHAIADRLPTYTLTRLGLVHRDAGRIRGGHLAGPVLAAHRCGRPVPAEHRAAAAAAVTPAAAAADPDHCPY